MRERHFITLTAIAVALCLLTAAQAGEALAQEVRGTVTDADTGEPLPGATITIQGTTSGTTTDAEGQYELTLPAGDRVLVFSFVGYVTREVPVEGREQIDVAMEPDVAGLEEVIVVGYGTQQRVNLTGSVGVTTAERLEGRSVANVGEALQGVVPNLNITVVDGDPTQSPNFNIRGFESINGGSPLILVDGVPMNPNRINPNDIESVSVLKDASASAVYGGRAAFGVVLIQTKSGSRREGFRIDIDSKASLAKPIFHMDPITDPHQFVLARNIATTRTNGVPQYDESWVEGTKRWVENPTPENAWEVVDGELRFYGYNNYQDEILTDFAPSQQHNVTLSGGLQNASFYASFGYISKDGYLSTNNEKFHRYNVNLRGEYQIRPWLQVSPHIRFNLEDSDKPHFYNWDVNVNSLARVSPIQMIQFPDLEYYIEPGDREKYEQYIGMYFGGTNFWPYLKNGGRTTFENNDLWLTQNVTLTPLANLTIRGDFSFNNFRRSFHNVKSKVEIVSSDLTDPNPISYGFSDDDWIDETSVHNQYYSLNANAQYVFATNPDHNLTLMAGVNQEWGIYRTVGSLARSLITPEITDINATVGPQQTYGSSSQEALRGVYSRINYRLMDRYLLELNARYDGTSRFPKGDRYGFFPSASAGWIILNEGFMSGTRGFLDLLKIRASWGSLGNQDVARFYPYISTMGIGTSPYIMSDGRIPFVSAPGLVSPTLTWETVVTRNLGVDVDMFDGRLGFVFDVYTRDTRDMLMNVNYPDILGTSAPDENAADLRTKGWELELNWRDAIGDDLFYNIGLNLSDYVTTITKYQNPNNALGDWREGQRVGEIWGFVTEGIFQTEEEVANAADQSALGSNWMPGDVHYADLNGDGAITFGANTADDPGDRKIIGYSEPRGSFGINAGIEYKGLRLTTFFQGVLQRDFWPSSGNWHWFFPFNAGHVEWYYVTDTWSEDNRDAYFPAPHISTNTKKNVQQQTRYLQNAAYIRLKDIQLGYRLPQSMLSKLGVVGAEVYLNAMNLWEYSPIRKPLDPEYLWGSTGTINDGAIRYPLQRVFSLGVRLSL